MVEHLAKAPGVVQNFIAYISYYLFWFTRHASLLAPLIILPPGTSLSRAQAGCLVLLPVFRHCNHQVLGGAAILDIFIFLIFFAFLMVFILSQSDIY